MEETVIDLGKPGKAVLPYPIVVKYENTLRVSEDNWRFRCITNVLRQTAAQIENYRLRYEKQ
jgi:hypothetical protein